MPEMSLFGRILALGTVLSFALGSVSGESVCLSCEDAVHPRDCTRVIRCRSHSDCYTDAYVTNQGSTRYNLGCRDRQQCANTNTTAGRRATHPEDLECSQCCTGDLCNNDGCNQQGYVPRYSRGPICYSCPRQQTTDDCQVITACGRDEVCKLKRVLVVFGSSQEVQYETTCEYKQKCEGEVNFYKQPAIGKKRTSDQFALGDTCMIQCCTDDLCNTGCTDWSITTQTTTAVCRDEPSCPLLKSSYDVCDNIPVARQFCARSCALCPHSRWTLPTKTTTPFYTTGTTTASTTTPTTTSTMTSTTTSTMTSTTTSTMPSTTTSTMRSTMTSTMTTGGTIDLTTEPFVLPTYGPELAKLLYVGARVVRGKDWKWGDQDGNGEGEITNLHVTGNVGWVHVKWDNGQFRYYRMGGGGAYDLMLVPNSYRLPTVTPGK